MDIKEIIKEHLIKNKYEGLFFEDGPCGCELDDLMCCGEPQPGCVPGYKHMDPRPEYKGLFAIWTCKEEPSLEDWENSVEH